MYQGVESELLRDESTRIRDSLEHLLIHKARLNREILRRKTMLLKQKWSVDEVNKSIQEGQTVLFDLDQTYAICPEVKALIANPTRGL